MSVRVVCHHGHELQLSPDADSQEAVVCRICGSLTQVSRSDLSTPGAGSDPTQGTAARPRPSDDVGLGGPAPSDESLFITLDYSDSSPPQSSPPQSGLPSGSQSPSAALTPSAIRDQTPAKLEPPKLDGFQIVKELGRGGMGVVYLAREAALGRDVAVKTLQRMNPESLHRFKQEFRALADVAHPNLASLYELLSDGDTWCFTMEVLEGVDFLEYIWSGFDKLDDEAVKHEAAESSGARLTPERRERLRDAMAQLAVGLHALHQAGVLHSDVKPSNVLMTTQGRLVLLDFGLAVAAKKQHGAKTIQGTPRYMSPEQAAGVPLTPASDWYSVGVMLYEVLTGRLPFAGKTMEILGNKQTRAPTAPSRLSPDNPPQWNDLCTALLSIDPRRRPSAQEVLERFDAVELAENIIFAPRGEPTAVELVGRDRHLQALNRCYAEVVGGESQSLFVHGRSGMGKSVLIRKFLDGIVQQEVVVLEGRCYEQESVPFKALDSLIDSLAEFLGTLPETDMQTVMPFDRLALTRVFPVLGRVPEAPNAAYPAIEHADQQELRQRALNSLRELLQRLSVRQPLVLYIDDLQWGDVDSAELLADLVRPPHAPRLLLLGSYRSEDVDTSLCLEALDAAFRRGQPPPHREELVVDSLTGEQATQLASMLLPETPNRRQLAQTIAEESGGWPFFVWELAQHVQAGPQIANQRLELDEVIWTRVQRLPPDARRLLALISVAGRPLPAMEACRALDMVAEGPGLLGQLRANDVVRMLEGDETRVETYHDRIRESVVSHLDQDTIKAHNLDLARTIERICEVDAAQLQQHLQLTAAYDEPGRPPSLDKQQWQHVYDLAGFYDLAAQPQKAFAYALVAAEQTRLQNALDISEQQYRIARRGAAGLEEPLRFRVAEGLADVLTLRGKYDEAHELLQEAEQLAKGDLAPARVTGKLGTLAFKRGDIGAATKSLEAALGQLGDAPSKSRLMQALGLSKELLIQTLHTRFPSRFIGRRTADSEQGRLDMLRVRLHAPLTLAYWFITGMVPTLWSHLRQMNLAERYPPSPELGRTYAFHAITMTGIPKAKRGIKYAERAYQIGGDLGDTWGQGQARSYHTFSCIVLAEFDEGVKKGREAIRLLEQAGDVWEANMARMIYTYSLYFLGDLAGATEETIRAWEIANETGDYSAMAIAAWLWAQIQPETLPEGVAEAERNRPREDPLSSALAIQARGLELLLREDNPVEGAAVLQECLDLAKRRNIRNVCVFNGVSWHATALRIAAERESGRNRQWLPKAKRAVRAALKITKSYRNARPHALREQALLAVVQSKPELARQCFDASLQLAESTSSAYEHAKTLLARGEAGAKLGWPAAEEQIAEATAAIAALRAGKDSGQGGQPSG